MFNTEESSNGNDRHIVYMYTEDTGMMLILLCF